ncbi:MAG: RnfABCDGE type electron transport complex subunit B [Clostridia bacterium]|nr:RnfABCDGE type electron transport complex subunit B [Clostridia bacterium]
MEILIPILAVTIIGLICGVGLSVASSVMAVKEDERFPVIRDCLPGANCGACGYSGCDGYAKALLEPGTKTNLCVPGADAVAAKIAEVLGVEAQDVVEKIAVVRCSGTCEATSVKEDYRGIESCRAAKLFFGGAGSCIYGCMGLGDCTKVCPKDAICMVKGIAHVDLKKCIGCGMCAKECPQQVITVVPDVIKAMVICSNVDKGAVTRKACTMGCIGCHKCEKVCEQGAITITNNLAHVDPDKCIGCGKCAEVCTTGALRVQDFSGAHRV